MIKASFGASTLSWVCPPWNNKDGIYAIEKASESGFDLIEILLPESMDIDTRLVKKNLDRLNLNVVCGLNLSAGYHIPTYPEEAIRLIKSAIDVCRRLESTYLGGVLHSAIGIFSGAQRTKEEEQKLFQVWNQVGEYADKYDITIGIEPINRYESYVCTGAEETIDLIERSGVPNLGLHLDTFHMNIEEQSFYDPIIKAGNLLKHIHMTENDRGMLGEGLVNWNDLFRALNDINYEGRLVLENFSTSVPKMAETVSLWRPSEHGAEELALKSLRFMKDQVNRFNQ